MYFSYFIYIYFTPPFTVRYYYPVAIDLSAGFSIYYYVLIRCLARDCGNRIQCRILYVYQTRACIYGFVLFLFTFVLHYYYYFIDYFFSSLLLLLLLL